MNWDALGAAGEIMGSLGVLITLVYLAIQVKQNNAYNKAQMYQARADAAQYLAAEFSDPSITMKLLGENFEPDPGGWEKLTLQEKYQSRQFAWANDTHLDNVLKQRELGLIDDLHAEISDDTDNLLRMIYFVSKQTNQKIRPRTLRQIKARGIDREFQQNED